MDLRIEKTERAIKNAFLELRAGRPLEKIKIRELCERAFINKSTFYAHYKDIYDLSEAMEDEIVENILNTISRPERILEQPANFTREMFYAYIGQSAMARIVFADSQMNDLPAKIEQKIREIVFVKYPELKSDMNLNLVLSFCINGSYHAYVYGDDQHYDLNKVIHTLGVLTERTVTTEF